MPSLLNFKPLLDTYDPNAGQEDIRQGMKEAAHYASKGIEAAGERGREREKEFESLFDLDVSKITDMESKNYQIRNYGKLKDKYVTIFENNKNVLGHGRLHPREKIELRGDMDSMRSEAEALKILDTALVEASDPESQVWGREIDKDKVKLYSEAKTTGDIAKMASIFESLGKSKTGNDFTKISDVDVPRYVMEQVDVARKGMETSKEIIKNQSKSGGNVYNTSTAITRFGTSQEASKAIYDVMDNKETGPVLEENLRKGGYLTDEQKKLAEENVGTYSYPLLKYYTDNVMDTAPILEESVAITKSTRPQSESEISKKIKEVELIEAGTDFGEAISINKTAKDADGKDVILKGALSVSMSKIDGEWMVQMIVPTAFEKEHAIFMESVTETGNLFEAGDISEEEKKALNRDAFNEFKSKGKWEQKNIPLKGVKAEIKRGLKNKKMVISGLDELTDDSLIPEFTISKKVSKKDQEAIDWIRNNPNDDRAKVIYDQLSTSGLIK